MLSVATQNAEYRGAQPALSGVGEGAARVGSGATVSCRKIRMNSRPAFRGAGLLCVPIRVNRPRMRDATLPPLLAILSPRAFPQDGHGAPLRLTDP